MAVRYTTHYMEEAERVCDRVGIIDHGRLIAEGCRTVDGITGVSIGEVEVHLLPATVISWCRRCSRRPTGRTSR